MSVGEGRREGSCDVSDKIENNFGFEGHIMGFEELLQEPEYSGTGQFGVLWCHLASLLLYSSLGYWQLGTHQPAYEE